jgi:hypothetical protein
MLLFNVIFLYIFILGFCIPLRVLYQGYWKNRPSQQLFKVFVYIYFAATCFGSRWPSSGEIHNYFREATSLQRIRCFVLLVLFGSICQNIYKIRHINKHLKKLLRGTVLPITFLYMLRSYKRPQLFASQITVAFFSFFFFVSHSN